MTTITWIKCSDELPDDESVVLLAFADGDVWTGFRDADVWRYVSADAIEAEVTHWAHLPPHPDDQRPDCQTCEHYLPPMYGYVGPACQHGNVSDVPCLDGDAYLSSIPVRLYEAGGG